MRAIIAAASSANDPERASHFRHRLAPAEIGSSGNNVERLVQLLVQEGITPGDLLMAAWQTLPACPWLHRALDDVPGLRSATRANGPPSTSPETSRGRCTTP